MTTPLSKPVTRLVQDRRHGLLNVTLASEGVVIREYGRRRALPAVSYGMILLAAAKISADEIRRERALKRRKARNR